MLQTSFQDTSWPPPQTAGNEESPTGRCPWAPQMRSQSQASSPPTSGCWGPPISATGRQVREEPLKQKETPFTFRIQHLGDVQVLLGHIEGCVQICEWVVLEEEEDEGMGGPRSHWSPTSE